MAYVKRPITQGGEYFKPDVYVNFRSTTSINKVTQEVKKGGVFVISKKNNETSGEYISKEVDSIKFFSLMILDKLENDKLKQKSDYVNNAYQEELKIKQDKTFQFLFNAKWNDNLKKFVDEKGEELLNFKVKKVLIGQLKDTKEIFTLELGSTQARNLMNKNFSRNTLFGKHPGYKLTDEEKISQEKITNLFLNGVDLELSPSEKLYKVGSDDTQFQMMHLLEVSGNTNEVTLDEKALKTIDILENQLAGNITTANVNIDIDEEYSYLSGPVKKTSTKKEEEISIEDIPFR